MSTGGNKQGGGHGLGASGGVGKKRKVAALVDIEAERTLYHSFVSSANALSSLYASASLAQRRGAASASRQTLEKILHWMMREFPSQESIPKTALLHFLQQEYESIEGCENAAPHPFPVQQLFPMMNPHGVASSGGGAYSSGGPEGRSPLRRGQSSSAMESDGHDHRTQDMTDPQNLHHSSGGGQFPYQ